MSWFAVPLAVAAVLSPGIVFKLIQKFFYWWHEAEPAYGPQVADYLLRKTDAPRWRNLGVDLLNRTFSERHLSWRCFRRSVLATILFSVSIFALLGLLILGDLTGGFRGFIEKNGDVSEVLLVITGIGLVINSIIDFISLGETRWLLRRYMKSEQSILRWIILDIAYTSIIFTVVYIMAGYAYGFVFDYIVEPLFLQDAPPIQLLAYIAIPLVGYASLVATLFLSESVVGVPQIGSLASLQLIMLSAIISTFASSIWLYIHATGIWAAKATLTYPRITSLLGVNPKKVENEPLKFLGNYVATTAAVAWTLVIVVSYMMSSCGT